MAGHCRPGTAWMTTNLATFSGERWSDREEEAKLYPVHFKPSSINEVCTNVYLMNMTLKMTA